MRLMHKYPLPFSTLDVVRVTMPCAAVVRTVQMQAGMITLWAEHEAGMPHNEERRFAIVGTGVRFPERMTYVGTVQARDYVWHIYEQ